MKLNFDSEYIIGILLIPECRYKEEPKHDGVFSCVCVFLYKWNLLCNLLAIKVVYEYVCILHVRCVISR
jgi:hypothetical protein